MANTLTVNSAVRAREQFQGAFGEMWKIKATVTDQDAVALTETAVFSITVAGVALGDHVISIGINKDLVENTNDNVLLDAYVSAANTVAVRLHADAAEFAADDLNGSVIKILIGRPSW